jgi:hypothetical protein
VSRGEAGTTSRDTAYPATNTTSLGHSQRLLTLPRVLVGVPYRMYSAH